MTDYDDAPVPERKPKRPVAVALKYERGGPDAPRVVATGKGAVAEQILNVAFAQGVRVREDADLAEVLSAMELESEIPLEAFAAVAEILSYIYGANSRARGIDHNQDGGSDAAR